MDPVPMALVAADTARVTNRATDVGKQAIVDTYNALKKLLKQKFGGESKGVKAMEEVAKVYADKDPELHQAAHDVVAQVRDQPGGIHSIQNVTGNYNASTQGGSSATVNVNTPKEHLWLMNPS
jgi:hypothetical protein